ncbi:hypothetical protein CH330_06040 [candidate division WOR-3 bacterium JGI_Cruoil_03_51_56]|uniref:Uncharacterized protein n=1 Tax=candidate division WOR-3 bacterium JGI_Cruoil_03_51_56 TaxID=1973747 RepID=A0A235BU54_UNCW3|nr:MAG: hypothetical protein CH330_06040 [candidate division WOR-3 bacterium JGI_Cruoil_03_51_56]
MPLTEQIQNWMRYPNALGSESQAGVLVGQVNQHLALETPPEVRNALRVLSLRSLLRDAFKELAGPHEARARGNTSTDSATFHDLTDAVLACAGLSQSEAIAVVTQFFEANLERL